MSENVYDKLTKAVAEGIPCDVFVEFWRATKDLEGDPDPANPEETISGSKKRKVLAAIDALDLTDRQKDELYIIQGYSESSLYNGQPEIIPEEAEIVRSIFDMFLSGMTLRDNESSFHMGSFFLKGRCAPSSTGA